jgi:hypothetical protein
MATKIREIPAALNLTDTALARIAALMEPSA